MPINSVPTFGIDGGVSDFVWAFSLPYGRRRVGVGSPGCTGTLGSMFVGGDFIVLSQLSAFA